MKIQKIFSLLLFFSYLCTGFAFAQNKEPVKVDNWGSEDEGKALVESIKKKFENFVYRVPGSKGNDDFSAFIGSEFKRIVGPENSGSVDFRQPVFVPGSFYLKLEDGTQVPLYAIEPNFIEVSNFEQKEFGGNLIYAGNGTLEQVDGIELHKSIILMDMDSGDRWQQLVPFGAEAILFIEKEVYSSSDADSKSSDAPLTMPRFLLRLEDQKKLQVDGKYKSGVRAKIVTEKNNVWLNKGDLKNHYAYVKGKDDSRLVIFSAHYDTNGFVPEFGANASDDVNLAMLLHLLEKFSAKPPQVSVMFVAFNGYYRGQVGPSEFMWYAFANETFLNNDKNFYQAKQELYHKVQEYYANYSKDKLEAMRNATSMINKRNYTWKKPMIDLLRGDQNRASEQIMNMTYAMKKMAANKKLLIEKSNALTKDAVESKQWEIAVKGSKDSFETEEDIQTLQSYILACDFEINEMIDGNSALEEKILKLSRNFSRGENDGEVKKLSAEFSVQYDAIKRKYELRRNKYETLKTKLTESPKSDSDDLQYELFEIEDKYIHSILSLFNYKKIKNDSITMQKLFNGNFSEQLFIQAKEGENRKLIDAIYEEKIKEYFQSISGRNAKYEVAAKYELDLIQQNAKIRSMTLKTDKTPKCVMLFDLNLTFGNDQFGFFPELSITMNTTGAMNYSRGSYGLFVEAGAFIANAINLSKNIRNVESSSAQFKNCITNTTTTGLFNTFALRNSYGAHYEAKTAGIPALVLLTTEDRSNLSHTTRNDYDTINPQYLINLWRFLDAYFPLLLEESDFIRTSLKPYESSYSSFVFNFVQQDNLAITVPETPVADVLFVFGASSTSPISGLGSKTYHGSGYHDRKILMSNEMGTISLRNIRKKGVYGYEAFQFNQDFSKINNVLDMRKGSKTFKNDLNQLNDDFKDFTAPVFNCEKIDIYGVFDYEKMTRYNSLKIIDGIQNSVPDNYCISGMTVLGGHPWVRVPRVNGGFTIFKKPETTIKLILENKVLLNSIDATNKKNAIGLGYNRETLHRKNIAWESFKDAKNLNTYRNSVLIDKGVNDSLVKQLTTESQTYYEKSKEALSKNKFSEFFRYMYTGFGTTYAAYPKVLQVMNDMMKAVVFYLALVIPFSFFIQRLCFPVTRIEHQLGFNAIVFFGTFLAFRYVHPAFELTDAPLIVLIAFVQIVLAMFVFNVLYNKFDARIKIIQGRTSGGDSAGSNIISQALIIGVNNMRKRKIRTILTCGTIILVTFTMLSFTSISSTVDPTMRRTNATPPYTGVFYAKNSWSGLSPESFVQAFPQHSQMVKRAWFDRAKSLFNIVVPEYNTNFNVSTFLGLETKEDGFLGKLPIHGRYFSSDDAKEVILSSGLAEILKINIKDFKEQDVLIMGEKYKLVGFFDPVAIENFKDIRGTTIMPQQPVGKAPSLNDMAELDESESDGNSNYRSMNSKMMGILPYQTVIKLGGSCVSISLKYDSAQKMWEDTKRFTTFSRENIYMSLTENLKTDPDAPPIKPGVFFIGNGFSTSIGGLADLIIPLIISATIIMNTMLGTVFERKKEIEIYTAVGLNPTQIGLFFIAEALVYGIIGSVAGYLIGQVASKVIQRYDLLKIDLNFSSLLVVYVMVLTILIVVISTIYPAFTAVKAAQPSGDGIKKSNLAIENDTIDLLYPFSFTEAKRFAINAFIREYILKFADASTGSFMSKEISVSIEEHYDSKTDFTTTGALIQKFDIALTPYDLGVTEIVEVVTFYHPKVNAFMLKMIIHRVSGTDNNWLRTNQPFVDEIRKLLLRWRVEPIAVQEKYQLQGEELFKNEKQSVEGVV